MGKKGVIFRICTEVRGPTELAMLPSGAHPVAPPFLYAVENGAPIALPIGMDEEEKGAAIRYGTHASSIKEADFSLFRPPQSDSM